jgi:hypothetical protein
MTKPTMVSQWDPGDFKPLDMSEIPGYPREMPSWYKKWLPRFTGNDATTTEEHMDKFWAFFQINPISDDVEDLAMKLFSATLHNDARTWYEGLPDKGIKTMDQFEETFLNEWSLYKRFSALNILGCPNPFPLGLVDNCPKFDGNPSLANPHVTNS